jgi:hypothetical protein
MSIKEIMATGQNIQLVVTIADLKEFALSLMSETQCTDVQQSEPMYTPAEFAKRHKVDRSTLWRWCKAGILKPIHIGGKTYYKESDLKTDEVGR